MTGDKISAVFSSWSPLSPVRAYVYRMTAPLKYTVEIYGKWGIYLTQVTPRCSMAFHGGLSAKSGGIRGPFLYRRCVSGVSGPAAVAGWVSLPTLRWVQDVAAE